MLSYWVHNQLILRTLIHNKTSADQKQAVTVFEAEPSFQSDYSVGTHFTPTDLFFYQNTEICA